jgi:hypothetical protein
MSEQKTVVNNSGIGLSGALFITFLVLKLTDVIDWSWWWVTAPLWIPLCLLLAFFGVLALIWAVIAIIAVCLRRRESKADILRDRVNNLHSKMDLE